MCERYICKALRSYYILRIGVEVKILRDRDLFGDGRHRLQSNTLACAPLAAPWLEYVIIRLISILWLLWLCSPPEPEMYVIINCRRQKVISIAHHEHVCSRLLFKLFAINVLAYSSKIYLICINKLCSLPGRKSDCVTFKFWQISHKMQHAVGAGVGPDNLRATGQLAKKIITPRPRPAG